MKTMKKVTLSAIACFVSVLAFSQINLGLQSTTQAALNTTVSSASVTKAASTTMQLSKSTANLNVSANKNVNTGPGISGSTSANANVQVNGNEIVDKAASTTKAVVGKVKSTVNETKEKLRNTEASVEVRTDAAAKAGNQ